MRNGTTASPPSTFTPATPARKTSLHEADPPNNPQVRVGTGAKFRRYERAPMTERFRADLSTFASPGGALDVLARP